MSYDYHPIVYEGTFSYRIFLSFDRKGSWLWHTPAIDKGPVSNSIDNHYIDNMPEFLSLIKQNTVLWSIISSNSMNAEGLENFTYRKGRSIIEFKDFKLDERHRFDATSIWFDPDEIVIILPTTDSSYYEPTFSEPSTVVSKGNIVTAKEPGDFTIEGRQVVISVEHYNSMVHGESYAIHLRFRRRLL